MNVIDSKKVKQEVVQIGDKIELDCKKRKCPDYFDYIDHASRTNVNFVKCGEYIRITTETFNNTDKDKIKEIICKAIDFWFEADVSR